MRVCMLVKNSFEFDARVTKEARSLLGAGHTVTVVAIHVPGVTARRETVEGIEVLRVPRIYGRVRSLLPDFLADSTTTPGTAAPGDAAPGDAAPGDASPGDARPGVSTAGSGRRAWTPLARRLLRRALPVAARPLIALNDVVVGRRMASAAVSVMPEVVHAHDLNTLGVGRRVARRAGARLVYDAHELHTARNDSTPVSRFVARALERRGVRAADAVVTATDTWADAMARSYGIPRPTVVRNLPPRIRVEQPLDLRARLGIPAGATILLYQGSIQTNRGIEQTIAALPGLPGCVLVVCGYGAHRPALRERVAAAGLDRQVRFDGPVPNRDLIAYSAGADIGLCLIVGSSESYRTSLPNKLFEYFMAGLPVVASDFPEMGAVVRRCGAGEVCDPTDPGGVAAAIDRLREPSRYATARDRAAAAATQFHWGSEEALLVSVYQRL